MDGIEDKDEKKSSKKDDDILRNAKKFYERAVEAEADNRERFLDDIRFARLGEQWPDGAKRKRELANRPCLTFNKLPSFIRQVVNDARQNKPSVTVIPVGSDSDKKIAEIFEGLIRNIEVQSNADIAYDTALDNAASGGWGYFRVKLDYTHNDSFDMDIIIDAITNPLTIYGDYSSTCSDSSDWMQCLVETWVRKSDFKKKYPKAAMTDWESDYRNDYEWINEDEVLVAEYWTREEVEKEIFLLSDGRIVDEDYIEENGEMMLVAGITIEDQRKAKRYEVTQYIMTAVEILETNEWEGQYIPIIPVYGEEVNENGERHLLSLHHQARGAQESYNYWRTSAVEKVALDAKSPWIGPKGAFDSDNEKWISANTENHAYIEFDGGMSPMRTPAGGVPAGDLQMALNANDDMKSIIGIYDPGLGAKSNETSGKAIMARQRESDTSTFHFIDNQSRAIRHLGKILVDLIPKVYTKPKVIRILKEDGTPEHVPVNQQVQEQGPEGEIYDKFYDLTVGKYDVISKSGPSFTSRREEAAEQMMQLIQAFPQAAPVIGDLIAKNLDWPGSDEIAERLQGLMPQPPQQPEVPPELMQQIEGVQQQVQEGQKAFAQLQQENNMLKLDLKNKEGELMLKERELVLKEKEAQVDMIIKKAELEARSHEMNNPQPDQQEDNYE